MCGLPRESGDNVQKKTGLPSAYAKRAVRTVRVMFEPEKICGDQTKQAIQEISEWRAKRLVETRFQP